MKCDNAGKLDRKSGVRWSEGHPSIASHAVMTRTSASSAAGHALLCSFEQAGDQCQG
jgi:hypothetical protein